MSKAGVFGLRNANDLFAKLEGDCERVKARPFDASCAYDFVVTAWHLLEWWQQDKSTRSAIRDREPLLQICEHLAVGAKHCVVGNPKIGSVQGTSLEGPWAEGVWADDAWERGVWDEWIEISLEPDTAAALGTDQLEITELADRMMDFWVAQGFTRTAPLGDGDKSRGQ